MYNKYIFDVYSNYKESKIIILPIPFDATSSYRKASQNAPFSILSASIQIDLFDTDFGNIYKRHIYMERISLNILNINIYVSKISKNLENTSRNTSYINSIKKINLLTNINNHFIYRWTLEVLKSQKIPIILGGEHSVVFGSIKACLENYALKTVSVLQIDAHADMHKQYNSFINSHASIIYNVLTNINIYKKIVQIGIRDISYNEYRYTCLSKNTYTFLDKDIRQYKLFGSMDIIVNKIIEKLDYFIYLTIDIDGFDISYCLNTGTPVPGGFSFDQIIYLLKKIKYSKKKIIGADICETSSKTIDTIISARLLYKLIGSFLTE